MPRVNAGGEGELCRGASGNGRGMPRPYSTGRQGFFAEASCFAKATQDKTKPEAASGVPTCRDFAPTGRAQQGAARAPEHSPSPLPLSQR